MVYCRIKCGNEDEKNVYELCTPPKGYAAIYITLGRLSPFLLKRHGPLAGLGLGVSSHTLGTLE
jgi:hypothetical protein